MKTLSRLLITAAIGLAPVLASAGPEKDSFYDHHIVIQISDANPGTFTKALNVVTNMTKNYNDAGEPAEIRVVAFNAGLNILRTDKSPEIERVKAFSESMPNVKFEACANTIAGMTKKEGKAPPIFSKATVVPAGAIEILTLEENGWSVLRP